MEADIASLHVCIDEGDAIAIKDALETLELSAYKIAEAMYGNVDLEAPAEGVTDLGEHELVGEGVLCGEKSEELDFDASWDEYAVTVDLQPGEMITWPQHT